MRSIRWVRLYERALAILEKAHGADQADAAALLIDLARLRAGDRLASETHLGGQEET